MFMNFDNRLQAPEITPSPRVSALRLPGRVKGSARQADRELLAQAPPDFLDTTHFDTVRFAPPDWAIEAFARAGRDGSLAYTGYRGHPDVLANVAENVNRVFGLRFDPSRELILTPGTQAGLFGTLASLIGQGDEVLLVDPDYLFSERILQFLGAKVTHIPLTPGPRPHPNLNALEDALKRGKPKLLLFSHPNNPTGAVYSPEVIASIANLANRHNILVLVDELYARLTYDDTPFVHLAALPGMKERTITLLGPSKTESLSGYRLGVVAAPAEVIQGIEDIQSITSLRAPAYAQHVLTPWLRDDGAWLASRLVEFKALREMTVKAFARLPWLKMDIQNGTAYAWPDVSALKLPDTLVCGSLMRDAHVLVSPGYQFGPSGAGHFRVCYARDEAQWAEALDRMVGVLDTLAVQAGLPGRTA
jgi:aspartate/methionine/tyrosine aminotransferase